MSLREYICESEKVKALDKFAEEVKQKISAEAKSFSEYLKRTGDYYG